MFEGSDFPKAIDEEVFNGWLESGRQSKIAYHYLLIVWDEYDTVYRPIYVVDRAEISQYEPYKESTGRESLIAAYDLYSESRVF